MDTLEVAADRLGAEGHGAVDPDADLDRPDSLDVAAETGRNLDRHRHLSALQALMQVAAVPERWPLDEVGRPAQLAHIGAALDGIVPVEHGESQGIDIRGDAVAEDQHEERSAG